MSENITPTILRTIFRIIFRTRALGAALFATLSLALGGCPLQTPAGSAASALVAEVQISSSTGGLLTLGMQSTLTATLTLKTGATPDVTWTTSDSSVVTLLATQGIQIDARANKKGQAVITATADGVSASMTMIVVNAVGSVTVTGPSTMVLGGEQTYTATVKDGDGATISGVAVSWSASGSVQPSNPSATMGTSLAVRAVGVGDGVVGASAGGLSGDATVVATATGITIAQDNGDPAPASIGSGQVVSLQATYTGMNGVTAAATDAQWNVTGSCTMQGTFGQQAAVRGSGNGSCTVTASGGGQSASATIAVITVTAIKITGDLTSVVRLGGTRMLSAVAMAGTTEVPTVPITWWQTGDLVSIAAAGNAVTATGLVVGQAALHATATGTSVVADSTLTIGPASLDLAASATRVATGSSVTITVTARDMSGAAARFSSADGVSITGATPGFASVSAGLLTGTGVIMFTLSTAVSSSSAVNATYGADTSNTVAFTVAAPASVVVSGPASPVNVGASFDLTATIKDSQSMTLGGSLTVSWADSSAVINVPLTTDGLTAKSSAAKLGSSHVVATVAGLSSPAYVVRTQPASVVMTAFSPGTILAGATAATTVTLRDANNGTISGAPASQVTLTSADTTKVTVGAGTGSGTISFTATGVAPTAAGGTLVTPSWTNGTDTVTGTGAALVVQAGMLNWPSPACTAAWIGPKTWRVSGFGGATSTTGTVVYDIYSAFATPPSTASTKAAMDAPGGVAKDVTVGMVAADVRFAVVARTSDGATSDLVACARGATVASQQVAGQAILLGGSGVYADDTSTAVSATNPRPLLEVAPPTATLDRTAPRPSQVFGGGLMGVGVRDSDGAQVLYKRPDSGTGADTSVLPATTLSIVKTDSSLGVCTDRSGITAFELGGKLTAGGSLTSFAIYTSTFTPTGDAADCALNVLASRSSGIKTVVSGVSRAAPSGDHRVIFLLEGALWDVDLTAASYLPRQLTDARHSAGALVAASNDGTGTQGAVETTHVFVLDPNGAMSRYDYATPPWATPVTGTPQASLAGADGMIAVNSSVLYVTVQGKLMVVAVSGTGTLTVGVTARDYASAGNPSVTLGARNTQSP